MSAIESAQRASRRLFDIDSVRADFPILDQQINGHPLVYLDNAATTQKPNVVIDAISDYYRGYNANVHRGAHALSDRATAAFEQARDTIATFIGSPNSRQVIWTRGTTEAVNLVAYSWGRQNITAGDVILVSNLEHHSNIVPWQLLAASQGATVKPLPINDCGEIDFERYVDMLDASVKLVCVGHVSNALGTVNPVAEMIAAAKSVGATTFVDGAQAVAHFAVDVEALDCDFYAFSGHKVFGPTGIGVLWGRESVLEAMSPFHGGGEMIETCSFAGTTFNRLPYKFEAGTPDIAGVIGLAAAVDYLEEFERAALAEHEVALMDYCLDRAGQCEGLQPVGISGNRVSVFSFLLQGAHPSDVGMLLDQQGVAVRTGHHCAQPLMERLAVPGTVRASFSIYNTRAEIDKLFDALEKVKQFL